MNITPQQAHKAFYQAAENIERNPGLYDFDEVYVKESDCPACMWGHVGRALSYAPTDCISQVAEVFGLVHDDLYDDGFFHMATVDYGTNAKHAAARLRAFADAKWPQPIITHTPSEYSFSELMESLGEAA